MANDIPYDEAVAIFKELTYGPLYFHVTVSKTVEVCKSCEGKGFYEQEELTDYHRRDYSTFTHACKQCKGEGRFTVTTKNIHFSHAQDGKSTKVPFSQEPITKNERVSADLYYTLDKPKKKS